MVLTPYQQAHTVCGTIGHFVAQNIAKRMGHISIKF